MLSLASCSLDSAPSGASGSGLSGGATPAATPRHQPAGSGPALDSAAQQAQRAQQAPGEPDVTDEQPLGGQHDPAAQAKAALLLEKLRARQPAPAGSVAADAAAQVRFYCCQECWCLDI